MTLLVVDVFVCEHKMLYSGSMTRLEYRRWCEVQDARRSAHAGRVDLIYEEHIFARREARAQVTFKDVVRLTFRREWWLVRLILRLWLNPTKYAFPHLKSAVRRVFRTRDPRHLLGVLRVMRFVLMPLFDPRAGVAIYKRMYEGRTAFIRRELKPLTAALARLGQALLPLLALWLSSVARATTVEVYAPERFLHPPPEPLDLLIPIQPTAPNLA